jgi:hypothetical protein
MGSNFNDKTTEKPRIMFKIINYNNTLDPNYSKIIKFKKLEDKFFYDFNCILISLLELCHENLDDETIKNYKKYLIEYLTSKKNNLKKLKDDF